MWKSMDKNHPDSAHYCVMKRQEGVSGMDALRAMFPDAEVNTMNFVLFSTSGVHGTYNTIEDAESCLDGNDEEGMTEVTFLIVHPRLVSLRYGNCEPETKDDISFLKQLRENSYKVVAQIGMCDDAPNEPPA